MNVELYVLMQGVYDQSQRVIGCFSQFHDAREAAEDVITHDLCDPEAWSEYKLGGRRENFYPVEGWTDGWRFLEILRLQPEPLAEWKAHEQRARTIANTVLAERDKENGTANAE